MEFPQHRAPPDDYRESRVAAAVTSTMITLIVGTRAAVNRSVFA